jgi:benzoate-CoA ligase family protein
MTFTAHSRFNIATWVIDRPAQEHPDRTAILGEPRSYSYRELAEHVNRAGNLFRSLKSSPGQRVLIALPDSPEFIAAFFGAVKTGAIAVPVNPWSKSSEFSHYLADSGADIVVAHSEVLPQLVPALRGTRSILVVVGEHSSFENSLDWNLGIHDAYPVLEAYPTEERGPAFFLYTSGSTGLPKGAVHRHNSMVVTTRNFAQGVLGMGPDDITLSVPKLFFAYGLGNGMYFPLSLGARTVLNPDRPKLDKVVELIGRYRPTILFSVPSFLRALLKEIESGLTIDFSSVRLVVYGGEPSPPGLFEGFKNRFEVEMLEGYGSTEMLQTYFSNRPGHARAGTCGMVVPNYEVRLLGDSGKDVAGGDIGTLWVKGDSAFERYWNKPEATAATKIDEWVVTGDRLYCDADGYYHFCGRNDDLIKISGLWVSPREVESLLSTHPDVEQAAAIAQKDDSGVLRLSAYVVSRGTRMPSSNDLRQFLASSLPEHMVPTAIFTLREFPLTGSGKIDRRSLPELSQIRQESQQSGFVAPRTPTEQKLAEIWSAVLKVPKVGVFDDFVDLGGDSISAMRCLSRVRQAFAVDIPLKVFFEATVLSQFAATVESSAVKGHSRQAR